MNGSEWVGLGLTVVIVLFLILIVWSKVQGDNILDILREIRDFIREGKQ